ncbi:hypothetical protein HG263_05495 [Pseudoalteromonas sp. JBTF-M23]|uniref:PIN like domain-containing protein n=1 Tax=Pseudoalteromonas caenipelagi TaxID=2726988 RepID=A0A849VB41_9GAMM|nr:PIN-like domain-containing protein [Pseudoalteromonas caenipelagi]NOU49990.1 hypothetical protein [Pseudoalteromonas caenipelagi]
MKDLFPGYFKEDIENLREIWDSSLFVFDANILLNLYRYSEVTRTELLRIFEKLGDRVWLSNRTAEEYLVNRTKVISDQERSYEETIRAIEKLKESLKNSRQHPFVNSDTMDEANSVFEKLCIELSDNKSVHTARISNDEIKDSIAHIFDNKVGPTYDDKRLKQLIIEGEERYKEKVPPGFKDSSKAKDVSSLREQCRVYGDYIFWSQVIDKANEIEQNIVLITDDAKEDWWQKFQGKTLGPHPDLVKEFRNKTNKSLYMYQAARFLELAKENLGENVSSEIVDEVRETRSEIGRRFKVNWRSLANATADMDFILEEDLRIRKEQIESEINKLNATRNDLQEALFKALKAKTSGALTIPDTMIEEFKVRISNVELSLREKRDLLSTFEVSVEKIRKQRYNEFMRYISDNPIPPPPNKTD